MLQNSLGRVFEALVVTLTEEIAPQVDDPYARSQVMAAAEIVNNLSTRVEWRRAMLEDEVAAAEALLGDRRGSRSELAADELLEDLRGLLERVAAHVEKGGPGRDGYLDGWLERESDRLRTGMYRTTSG